MGGTRVARGPAFALALISCDSLAAYEAYRTRLRADAAARKISASPTKRAPSCPRNARSCAPCRQRSGAEPADLVSSDAIKGLPRTASRRTPIRCRGVADGRLLAKPFQFAEPPYQIIQRRVWTALVPDRFERVERRDQHGSPDPEQALRIQHDRRGRDDRPGPEHEGGDHQGGNDIALRDAEVAELRRHRIKGGCGRGDEIVDRLLFPWRQVRERSGRRDPARCRIGRADEL